MTTDPPEPLKSESRPRFRDDLRRRLITGMLVLLPLGVTFVVLRFLFKLFAGILAPVLEQVGRDWPEWLIASLSLVLIVITVYLVGVLGTHLIGRKVIAWVEALIARIPVANAVYGTAKQVVDSVGMNHKRAFQKVVLAPYPSADCRALGFQTGTVTAADGEELIKIFIPTAPNPTSGFLFLARAEAVVETGLTVEQALKMIVSGGIIAPPELPACRLPQAGTTAATKHKGTPDD